MEMTSRERLLAAIRGQETDRVPWSPFLAYYWEHQPASVQAIGQEKYMQDLGADPLLRGFHPLFETTPDGWTLTKRTEGNKIYTAYETPVGTLREEHTLSGGANSWFLTKHPVETEEDFKILQYITEHSLITENIAPYEADKAALGEGGLYVPVIGHALKTSFQSLVEHWCGTENLVYALCDFPELVEETLAVMQAKDDETLTISLRSSAEGFIFWEDSSTTNISPDYFSRYTAPEVNAWGRRIHAEGRFLIHHACGHLRDLLPLMGKTEIDVVESISPPPTGNIDLQEAAGLIPHSMGLIGGLEPVFLETCTMEQLDARVEELLTAMKGRRFVLANSDSCPPGVAHEKFLRVSEAVRRF